MLIMTIIVPSLRPRWVMMVTLPETNKSPPKIGLPRKIVFQPSICKGELLVGGRVSSVCSQECGGDNRQLEAQVESWLILDGLRRIMHGWEIRQKRPKNHPAWRKS